MALALKKFFFQQRVILIAFVLIFSTQCFLSIGQKSWAYDEPKHIASAYHNIFYGHSRLAKDTTVISTLWGLPLLLFNLKHISANDEIENHLKSQNHAHAKPWNFGIQLLQLNYTKQQSILLAIKALQVLLGLALGFLLFFWSKQWFGEKSASFCLALYAYSPSILAYSRIIGTDIILTLAIGLFVFLLYRDLEKPTLGNGINLTLAMLFCMVAKLNGLVYLLTLLPLLIIGLNVAKGSWPLYSQCKRYLPLFLVALSLLNAAYLFKGSFKPLSAKQWQSKPLQTLSKTTIIKSIPLPFSSDYIDAYDYTLSLKPENQAYKFLFGAFDKEGWWYYFLAAFILKTTIPILILLSLAALFRPLKALDKLFFLLAPIFVVFFYPSFIYKLNIGFRYVLPALPFVFLLVSSLLAAPKSRWLEYSCYALLLWHAMASLIIFPSYTSYFNELIGGPMNAYKYLDNSNLGWGENKKAASKYFQDFSPSRGVKDPYVFTRAHFMIHSREIGRSQKFPYGPDEQRYKWVRSIEPIKHFGYEVFVYDTRN